MTYELAKQLKDAGFPRKDWGGLEDFAHPTLEELIEVLKQSNPELALIISYRKKYCSALLGAYCTDSRKYKGDEVEGETPTIAVARLWLKLNKK